MGGPAENRKVESVMKQIGSKAATKTRLGLGAFALAALALPAAAAFASAEDSEDRLSAEQLAKGRQMFTDNGCNSCHALADANAAGSIGPAFDGNGNLDDDYAVNVILNGQGA